MRMIGLAGIVLALSGCQQLAEMRTASDNSRCQSYGFTPGTDAFAQCRMNIDLQRRAEPAAAPVYAPTTTTCRNFMGTVTCQTN
jgi:hypothetical protein